MPKFIHKETQIIKKNEITSSIFHLILEAPFIAQTSKPGQFIHIKINGKSLRRPISIFSVNENCIEIIFKVCGEGTLILSKMAEGLHIDILGPLGNPFPQEGGNPLFLAGGLGAAPLNFLASSIKTKGIFIYGAIKKCDFLQLSETVLQNHQFIKVCEDTDEKLVTDVLPLYIDKADRVYIAGPKKMLKAAAQICIENNKEGFITWEERMGCGFGVCQVCAVKTMEGYKRACMEGPIFNLKEIDWNGC
jgi:dihydroorotate dehydrogenase electron transfer subunit